jgi:DNA-binding MarR family transcriptional regulator
MSTKGENVLKNIGRLISILHRQAQVYINYTLKELNITSAECAFLLYLYKQDGVTQDVLSSYLYIDKSATARAIKSLEKKGYIKKDRDTADKRCNRVYLTERARGCRDEIRKKIWCWNEFLNEGIDEEDWEKVFAVLEKMVQKVEQANLKKRLALEGAVDEQQKPTGRGKDLKTLGRIFRAGDCRHGS